MALDIPIRAEPVFAVIVVMCFATRALLVARIVFIVYGVEGKTFILLVTRVASGGVVFGKARLPVFIPCVLLVPSVSVVRFH